MGKSSIQRIECVGVSHHSSEALGPVSWKIAQHVCPTVQPEQCIFPANKDGQVCFIIVIFDFDGKHRSATRDPFQLIYAADVKRRDPYESSDVKVYVKDGPTCGVCLVEKAQVPCVGCKTACG
jgi:hypothetical protein